VAVLELPLDLFKTGEVSLGSVAEIAGIGHLQLNEESDVSAKTKPNLTITFLTPK